MLKAFVLLLAATTASALHPGRAPALRRVVAQPRAFTPFLMADDADASPTAKIAEAVCTRHTHGAYTAHAPLTHRSRNSHTHTNHAW